MHHAPKGAYTSANLRYATAGLHLALRSEPIAPLPCTADPTVSGMAVLWVALCFEGIHPTHSGAGDSPIGVTTGPVYTAQP